MNPDDKYILVVLDGKSRKKPRRKLVPLYKRKWNKLQEGRIARVNMYNWNARCNTPPKQYIHRVYKKEFKVIDVDKTGFTVLCLSKKGRWPSPMG